MNIYNYSELDETAKEKARQEIADEFFSPCSMSIQFSVMKIKEHLPNIPDVKNVRLFKWIINHLPLSTPKIYEKSMTATGEAPTRTRKSKIIKIFGNPYTGTGYDYIAIETVKELKKRLKAGELVTANDFWEILYKKADNEFYKLNIKTTNSFFLFLPPVFAFSLLRQGFPLAVRIIHASRIPVLPFPLYGRRRPFGTVCGGRWM